jgi:hypothetical protein
MNVQALTYRQVWSMEQRERILVAVGELTSSRRRLPSLLEVAEKWV